jgi:hypothetical protein
VIVKEFQQKYSEELKLNLEDLEAFSLKSSEEISEMVESLNSCILSNTKALERSLEDLIGIKRKMSSSGLDIEQAANKILS